MWEKAPRILDKFIVRLFIHFNYTLSLDVKHNNIIIQYTHGDPQTASMPLMQFNCLFSYQWIDYAVIDCFSI